MGLSRVHDFEEHRILYISTEGLQKLKTLKQNPLLAQWLNNYDANGKWQQRGFQKQQKVILEKYKTKLALVELDDWSNKELVTFIKELNLIMPRKRRAEYKKTLQVIHAKIRTTLLENNGRLLKKEQETWKQNLRAKQWKNMNNELLKTHAKCIGIQINQYTPDKKVRKAVEQVLAVTGKKRKRTKPVSPEPKGKKRRRK